VNRRTLGAAAIGIAVWIGAPAATPQYRAGTHLVSIFATVTDRDHHLVTDLSKDDFSVYDDGKRQPLTVFSNDSQPITIVVMLDRSGSMAERFDLVERATTQFIDKLSAADRARIGDFSDRIVIQPAQFTNDHGALIEIVKHDLQEIGASPVWASVDRSVAALRKEPGRRVVLLFTDGHDSPGRGQYQVSLPDVTHRAQADEVMVYTIGLTVPDESYFLTGIPRVRGRPMPQRPQKMLKPDGGLKKLAEATGGGYFELEWTSNLTSTFARVAEELHRQYWLGFAPASLDGKVHKLEVKVKRGGTTVRARPSYIASGG
jgi:VWFA-related protein